MIDYESVYRVAGLLLDCACGHLTRTPQGCPARRCVVAGDAPQIEVVNCCKNEGQLTVNVTRVYPSRNFPTPDLAAGNCDVPYSVASYSVQVWRCHPVGNMEHAPSCELLAATARISMSDIVAVRAGITCCLRDDELAGPIIGFGYAWSLGDHVTVGPEGGCVGTNLQVLVGIPNCFEC